MSSFPNLFLTFGPNSGRANLRWCTWSLSWIRTREFADCERDLKVLDVKEEVQARYNKSIQKRLAKTNWNSGCKSWPH